MTEAGRLEAEFKYAPRGGDAEQKIEPKSARKLLLKEQTPKQNLWLKPEQEQIYRSNDFCSIL